MDPLRISGVTKPLPRIVVGTAAMGSMLPDALAPKSTRKDELAFLDACLELGCTAFDTAAIYQLGGSERLLGAWLSARGVRDRVFLITKGAHPNPVLGLSHFSPKQIESELHDSLKRLRTEHVELYLLHRDDPSRPFEPVVEAVSRFVREGKIGAWGVSNWSIERLAAAHAYAIGNQLVPPAANSPHFSLFEWVKQPWSGTQTLTGAANEKARAWHVQTQVPVLAWSPLGHGYLTDPPSAHGLKHYGNAANDARKQRAAELAKQKGVSPGDVALAYLTHQKFPVAAIVASTKPERMKKNLAAAQLELSDDDVRWLHG